MIHSLSGTVRRLSIPQLSIDVNGVGYLVTVPHPLWDTLFDGSKATIVVHTYVREDRLELFGFTDNAERLLFMDLIGISGIGPKTALEICSIPRSVLVNAVMSGEAGSLTQIKGIGKKTAEKLLVDLKALFEKHPDRLMGHDDAKDAPASFDRDAIAALVGLGYDQATIVKALKKIPAKITRTEDRVTAVLRSL
jgi:holliday junction DNA helicase RuvA